MHVLLLADLESLLEYLFIADNTHVRVAEGVVLLQLWVLGRQS